LKLEEKFK